MDNVNTQNSDHNVYHRRVVGFFGELSLDYMNMLYLNATGRYDIVSSMPNGNRGFFYPSVGLGFVFTELEPLKGQTILSFGKLRASYAEVGQAADVFNAKPVFISGGGGSGFLDDGLVYPLNGTTGYKYSTTIYNPKLVPQNTKTIEFGLNLKFLNNRLGL
ncbi:MAG: TonB-dependent receptor [Chloroflexia bacterium]|nr:TonB-dependent receptor [Chloroflexia bacterium]